MFATAATIALTLSMPAITYREGVVAVEAAVVRTLDGPVFVRTTANSRRGRHLAFPFVTPFDPTRWDPFELWSDSRMLQLAYGAGSPWTPAQLTRLGLVVDRPKAASLTCSSWLALDNPCWVVGTVVPQASKPPSPQAFKPSSPPR